MVAINNSVLYHMGGTTLPSDVVVTSCFISRVKFRLGHGGSSINVNICFEMFVQIFFFKVYISLLS